MQLNKIYNIDCLEGLELIDKDLKICIVTDPPFNIKYKYKNYQDNMKIEAYYEMLSNVIKDRPSVVIHYPEQLHLLSIKLGIAPSRVVSWVYNSNTGKQHRDIAFYNIKPDFSKVRQPYKNLNDKRIIERIKNGCKGAKLYDWWNINQVKNVSKDKTDHPCQMPVKVMENILNIIDDDYIIIDTFMGSGTTAIACINTKHNFIGFELSEEYCNIANERIRNLYENF